MTPPAGHNALLVNVAGLDWQRLHPLIDAGLLPHLHQRIQQGAMGTLRAPYPLDGAMLWSSLATGQPGAVHGIVAHTKPDGQPVGDADRANPALWQIAARQGLSSVVLGGCAVNDGGASGALCVADTFGAPLAAKSVEILNACLSDPALVDDLSDCWVRPEEIDLETIAWFVPGWQQVDQDVDPGLARIADALALTLSRHAAATWLIEHAAPRLTVIDYPLFSLLGPWFLAAHATPPAGEGEASPYALVITRACQLLDMLLAQLAESAGPAVNLVLTATHGLRQPGDRTQPDARAQPHREGILVAAGPAFRADALVHGAALYDVTPTLLALLGLPLARDMAGRVLHEAFATPPALDYVDQHPPVTPSADTRPSPLPVGDQAQVRAQLGALGMPVPELGSEQASHALAWQWNLARACRQAGQLGRALPVLETLSEAHPDRVDFLLELMECQLALGLIQEAREGAEILHDYQPGSVLALLTLARVAQAAGEHERSLDYVDRAVRAGADSATAQVYVGLAYLRLHRWEEALAAYRAASGDSVQAACGEARALLGLRRFQAAAEAALRAVGLDYQTATAHHLLGMALLRLGREREAAVSFTNCIRLAPGWASPHAQLLRIKRRLGHPPETWQPHREALARGQGGIDALARLQAEAAARQQQRVQEREALREQALTEMLMADPAPARPRPQAATFTLVSGLPRAGCGAVLDMLEAGGMPVLRQPAGDAGWSDLTEALKSLDLLERAAGRAVYVPSTLLTYLPRLHHYRVVFVDRPIGELVVSQRRSAPDVGGDLPDYEQGRLLLRHRNGVLWALRGSPQVSLLRLDMAGLIDVPEGPVDRLRAFLGEDALPDRAAMLRSLDPARYTVRMGSPLVPRVLHDPVFVGTQVMETD